MPISDQKASKIRAALTQLDPANDEHWTDDGLPRETIVQGFAGDKSISRKDIQDAHPGFQRQAQKPAAEVDPLTGEPTPISDEAKGAYHLMKQPTTEGEGLGPENDPAKNTGDYMSDEEVRVVLEQRVKDAEQGIVDAQANVRAANQAVIDSQEKLKRVKDDLTREFPPLTQAQNIKQYIASEMAQRAAQLGHGQPGIAPGSQIDAAMQRSNSRGWRRPSRNGQVQTGAARV